MKMTITDAASQWFKSELALPDQGAGIRFFGKVYGKTQVHDGFSIGMTRDDTPEETAMQVEKDGVLYYVNDVDAWFFERLNMTVDYDPKADEPKYEFVEEKEEV
ncbi:HesB/YadR/YfhF family protein [Lacticaseibacillus saniviri]|uniref:Core domain-containing protein n=1 Tax=Lacticaseibacillus saniviri JCM 17471 = DSM 24301 TaxID=1293598 RepID=A0A0R2MYU4_9LACO|nr:iron-sulfur cluster biosynthesis family protein [Lacticaseibacillus saniviri]KRO18548.1 hypothetical protein IV56_GL000825 [Lacticaseibacillus saniviri JCM 17471 = DSM 24301]MCG4281079.1 iron-sulfur cluster biosynthesis protein [Lacticaseibacillus saniviri]